VPIGNSSKRSGFVRAIKDVLIGRKDETKKNEFKQIIQNNTMIMISIII